MVRLILLFILFFLGYTLVSALLRTLTGNRSASPPPEKTAQGDTMVKDPQCGTYVPRGDAITKVIKGKTHYFCSTACRDAYRGDES